MQSTLTQFFKRSAGSVSGQASAAAVAASSPKKAKVEESVREEDELRLKTEGGSVVASVKDETKPTWVDMEIDRLEDEKWNAILRREGAKSKALFAFLNQLPDQRILPPKNKVFEAFRLCPFDNVKVVVLGQDPYHGIGQAHGLAFSVQRGVQVPPSLRNIFKECTQNVQAKNGQHGNLECWARQGVLMLNALLTVEAGKPMAHKGRGWEAFTDACIQALSKDRENLVFMLWGKPAQEKGRIVDRKKHLVLTSSHPSPLGATKTAEPFIGSQHFLKCNAYLKKHGLGEINWDVVG